MATSTVATSALADIPGTLKPYLTDAGGVLPKAQALLAKGYGETYGDPLAAAGLAGAGRVASLSPMQQQIGSTLQNMGTPSQYAMGTQAAQSGLGSLGQAANAYSNLANVNAPALAQYQMQAAPSTYAPNLNYYQAASPGNISAQNLQTYQMQGAQNVQAPQGLQTYQMSGPQQYTGENVSQYMSPYAQQVMDVQKQEALRDFGKGLTAQNLGAARTGTYGGARNLLANTEMQRNLQTQLGSIQATGLQNAFQNAQSQFNTSQAQQQAANQANLQAALGVQQLGTGQNLQAQLANQQAQQAAQQANLQAALGVQQLGSGQNLQAQQANQQTQQALNLANLQAMMGTQQFGAGQNLQSQLANQQTQQAANQANLQALLGVQQLGAGQSLEAQRANQAAQLSAAQGLGTVGTQYGQLAQGLGQLGTAQQASAIDLLKTQGAYGDLQRATQQQQLDAQYQDLMTKLNYPISNLATMNDLLRGVPITQVSSTQTTTTPPPSFASQLAGTGLAGLSLYNMFK